jgi:hypothetical protein
MLVSAYFRLKSEDRLYIFNPMNVLYIDRDGVLFAPDVYRMFADGEYEIVMRQIDDEVDARFTDIDNV